MGRHCGDVGVPARFLAPHCSDISAAKGYEAIYPDRSKSR
jgi:hypothetical protein